MTVLSLKDIGGNQTDNGIGSGARPMLSPNGSSCANMKYLCAGMSANMKFLCAGMRKGDNEGAIAGDIKEKDNIVWRGEERIRCTGRD